MTDEPEAPAATPEQVGRAARDAILQALDILDRQGTPLAALLAQQARARPDRLLAAAARFAPTQTKIELGDSIKALHLQALRALAATPIIIDQAAADVLTPPDWAR
jgi:hypothetical protein